jgi:hypothetical protein
MSGKKVYQFTLEKEFISEYSSINEASRKTNISRENIKLVCHKKRDSTGNFIWSFTKDLVLRETKRQQKEVYQYDFKLNFIKKHDSVSEAEKETGVNASNISKAALNKRQRAGKYIWDYEDLSKQELLSKRRKLSNFPTQSESDSISE